MICVVAIFSDSLLLHNSQSNIFSFPGLFSLSLKNLLCWKSLVGKSTKANTKSRQLAHMIAKMVKMVGQDPLLWSFDLSRWFTTPLEILEKLKLAK